MSREMLKNYCVEPTTAECVCARDVRCGGLVELSSSCPEHSSSIGTPVDLMKTHFHAVQEAG